MRAYRVRSKRYSYERVVVEGERASYALQMQEAVRGGVGDGEEEGGEGELEEPLLVGSALCPDRGGRGLPKLRAPTPPSSLFSQRYTFLTLRVVANPSPRLQLSPCNTNEKKKGDGETFLIYTLSQLLYIALKSNRIRRDQIRRKTPVPRQIPIKHS